MYPMTFSWIFWKEPEEQISLMVLVLIQFWMAVFIVFGEVRLILYNNNNDYWQFTIWIGIAIDGINI